ncbi:helicase C-terminal domain-containing protein [Leptotrichia hongkongensis]|uniref:helicase C-terminal domain-containing protein n=1 Tax=Leptotrichia hongkongensis TaxID=554406 RepID=UPI0035A97873
MKIVEFISAKAMEHMRLEISESGGNEVFFRGIPDGEGIVSEVEVIARGNSSSVAALLNMMRKNEVIIHNHPSGVLIPSDEDVSISSMYGEVGGASYIVNNAVDDIYVIVPLKEFIKIDIDEYFGENGVIHKNFGKFEVRREQYEMAKSIENSMNDNKKLIVEAGTGTGKTIAYLLPTLLYAIENNLKVIVSTNTINLQEQLVNKDIPLLKKIINEDFNYQIVKGRGNYLCKRKLYNIDVTEKETDTEEERTEKNIIRNLIDWDKNVTRTGDRNELKYEISNSIWEKVNSEVDMCKGVKCPHYSKCHFFKARKNVADATLLIVNHHMFFADLAIRNQTGFYTNYSILPNYDIVVFDEAHNIEDTARNYFTFETSKISFGRLMGNIYNRRVVNSSNGGAIVRLMTYLNESLSSEEYEKVDELKEDAIAELNIFYDKGIDIFDKLIYLFSENNNNREIKIKIDKQKMQSNKAFREVMEINSQFKESYGNLVIRINKFLNTVSNYNLEDKEGFLFEFSRYYERLKQYYKKFEFILEGKEEGYVYWANVTTIRPNVKLYATPFDISDELNDNLFTKMDRMVFTSATLAVDNKFDYYKKSIGLMKENRRKIDERIVKSPFDYEKQMKVYIPEDALDPTNIEFLRDLEEFIEGVIKNTKGHCFLLFTSYSALNFLYNQLKSRFSEKEYTLIKQNDFPRHEMIEIFKNSKNPILFGTDSFWEGVDVQGEQLQSVIITKLPFKVPNDPVTEAIIENIRKNGQNPFNDYQVPQAVIKFKQGVGRLIRSKTDSGNIIILDNRIIKKMYGKKFLSALPRNKVVESKSEILKKMK